MTTAFAAHDESDYAATVRQAEAIRRYWRAQGVAVTVRVEEVKATRIETTWGVRSEIRMGKP